jgi:PAS domain S-box-containing protein
MLAAAALAAVILALVPEARNVGYGPLAFLPIVWLALHEGPRRLLAFGAAVTAAFVVFVAAGVIYGGYELRRSLLFLASAAVVSAAVYRLARRQRAAAAEREEIHSELADARRRLEEAQAQAHVGSWEWDLEGDRFTCSDELRRIYGIGPDIPVGSRFVLVDSVYGQDREPVSEALEQAVDARKGFRVEHRIVRGDGAVRWLQVSARMNGDQPGRLPHIGGTALDVTQAHHAKDRLERSNQELERYAYFISHDLSEPARVMAGFARMLETRHGHLLDTEGRRFVASIVKGAERMEELIRALLAYARVGSDRVDATEVELDDLVRDVLETLAPTIVEREAVVEAGELPAVRGDPVLLTQVLQNLIANAIKFCGEESPRVVVTATRGLGEWTISVRDNGCGIDPRQADRVWGIFERLHDGSREGTGVGLAICKRIVERHGGRIWMRPAEGGGSEFSFSLPDVPVDLTRPEAEAGEQFVVFSA